MPGLQNASPGGVNARVEKSQEVAAAGGTGMILVNVTPGSLDNDFHSVPTIHVDEVAGEESVFRIDHFLGKEAVQNVLALRFANGVRYGLASSVWTRDHARALRMSRALDFGCVWINTHIPLVAEMPHGGFKQSGYGKDLSVYGFEDYTRIKHVMSAF